MSNKVIGNIVGIPNPKPDWNQTDEKKADFIKNKPDISGKEDKSNKVKTASDLVDFTSEEQYPTAKAVRDYVISEISTTRDFVNERVGEKEDISNRTANLNVNPGNDQYPTALAVADYVDSKVGSKEDTSNKTSTVDANSTDTQYPSAKAVYEYDHNKWELIETITFAKDVQRVNCDLKNGFYKELYIRFVIPTMNPDKTSGFQKARSFVYANGTGSQYSVYDDGDYRYEDTGVSWILTHHLKMIGNICTCEKRHYNVMNSPYVIGTQSFTIGKDIGEPYIDSLSILMYPQTTRLFPTGTTYELWGVRA